MDSEITRIGKFIWLEVEQAKAEGVIIGLSGGLDSAVVAFLAVGALGKERVHGLFMPTASTPQADWNDVLAIILQLDIPMESARIDEIVASFNISDIRARANITSRVRMIMLYAEANVRNALVIGTSDRSELELGYFTKWGDGAADILPIAHLYKTEVRRLAKMLGVPENIVKKPSTPGLVKGQTAEDELGFGYDEIDRMLKGEIAMHSRIEKLMANATHKQIPAPRLKPQI